MRFLFPFLLLVFIFPTVSAQTWQLEAEFGGVNPLRSHTRMGANLSVGIGRTFTLGKKLQLLAGGGLAYSRYYNDDHFIPSGIDFPLSECYECVIRNERFASNRFNAFVETGLQRRVGKFQIVAGLRLGYDMAVRFTGESFPLKDVDVNAPISTSTLREGEHIFYSFYNDDQFSEYRLTTNFPLSYFAKIQYIVNSRWSLGLTWRESLGRYDVEQIFYRITRTLRPRTETRFRHEIADMGFNTAAISLAFRW